jgi:hypothetical protein
MVMAKKATRPTKMAGSQDQQVVVFEYIKSNFFRVIHADGAIGGITPEGNLHLAFFSDRPAIPKMQVHQRNADGSLGEIMNEHTVVRPGIIREMDIDVVFNREAAKSLVNWINQQLEILDSAMSPKPEVKKQ